MFSCLFCVRLWKVQGVPRRVKQFGPAGARTRSRATVKIWNFLFYPWSKYFTKACMLELPRNIKYWHFFGKITKLYRIFQNFRQSDKKSKIRFVGVSIKRVKSKPSVIYISGPTACLFIHEYRKIEKSLT